MWKNPENLLLPEHPERMAADRIGNSYNRVGVTVLLFAGMIVLGPALALGISYLLRWFIP